MFGLSKLPQSEILDRRLLGREVCGNIGGASTRGLYGSRAWVDNLDITNELYGHMGCVNALSWSRSGHLLASGSDDTFINIHTTADNFVFNTTIETGHTGNIFSVNFMPFNERKIVSCAGDWEVRVFDIEYASSSNSTNCHPRIDMNPSSHRRRTGDRFWGQGLKSPPEANRVYTPEQAFAKVYTTHSDRVKRIVTEDTPHLFLTCSEDGDVRQFDLRQPSEYYRGTPPSQSPRNYLRGLDVLAGGIANSNPPLISYKNHRIELNTISCSVSQPHYLALGGNHQHCFLHDRRMLGRDTSSEMGIPSSFTESELSAATRCVKRFSPRRATSSMATGLKRLKENTHITACKISDAYPDEIVVSWSADNIYLFDINRSPDAADVQNTASGVTKGSCAGRVVSERDRKGKGLEIAGEGGSRAGGQETEGACRSSPTHSGGGLKRKRSRYTVSGSLADEAPPRRRSAHSRDREEGEERHGDVIMGDTSGESKGDDLDEELHKPAPNESESPLELTHMAPFGPSASFAASDEVVPGESLMKTAALVVDLRRELFELQSAKTAPNMPGSAVISYPIMKKSFTAAIGLAKICIDRMDSVIEKFEHLHITDEGLSSSGYHRARTRRFVQVSGALAFALGGHLQVPSPHNSQLAERYFGKVEGVIGPEDWSRGVPEKLGWIYSFVQLIINYIQHGRRAIFTIAAELGFYPEGKAPGQDAQEDRTARANLFDYIESWYLQWLDNQPLMDVDSPNLVLVETGEAGAWRMFRRELEKEELISAENRRDFWGIKIARALVLKGGHAINFSLVHSAFDEPAEEVQEREEEEELLDSILQYGEASLRRARQSRTPEEEGDGDDQEDYEDDVGSENDEDELDNGDEEDEEGEEEDDDDDVYGESEDNDEENSGVGESLYANYNNRWRGKKREVDAHAPIGESTQSYSGHCNVKTVKDVNFYGLNDEYVVSGSDCGHIFIWEKKTSKLVQLLHGDEDTVNVVTGHPYEPQLAVSGIDHTVKIFSPDQLAQVEFLGVERQYRPRNSEVRVMGIEIDEEPYTEGSRRRLEDEYRIRSQNETMRETGVHEALVTRALLGDLAARLRDRHENGEDISMGDQCVIS